MNNEEKILELLTQMQQEQHQIRLEQQEMREEQRQIRLEQQEMREEQRQIRLEQQEMREEQSRMRDDITRINLRLELDVEKRFDAVNEGIDAILEKLTPKSRVDALEADVTMLKTALRVLTQDVDQLKKAQ